MKRKLTFSALTLALSAFGPHVFAQTPPVVANAPDYGIEIDMRPSEKRPLELKPNERNPYEKRSAAEDDFDEADADSEEAKIRGILTQLRVGGFSRGAKGLRILFGDMNLEVGMELPQLIPNQNDLLVVTEISEEALTLSWKDAETGIMTDRNMQLTFDLTPTIAYSLPGQPPILDSSGNPSPSTVMGIHRLGQERKKEAEKMNANNSLRDIPKEAIAAGQ